MSERFFGWHTICGDEGGTPYMTRIWIGRLRLHVFHRGDADPDCHDHPWDFWTLPLTPYVEEVAEPGLARNVQNTRLAAVGDAPIMTVRVVRAFRLHFRPAEHCHRVLGRYRGWDRGVKAWAEAAPDLYSFEPIAEAGRIVTLVWRGGRRRKWGFLKHRDGRWCWSPWREYVFGGGKHAPCEPGGGNV